VPADVALWPRLTGAEILDLLGNVRLGVDAASRDELVDRDFERLFPYIC
jgi:polyether ionophore transport system ATP-binding protein